MKKLSIILIMSFLSLIMGSAYAKSAPSKTASFNGFHTQVISKIDAMSECLSVKETLEDDFNNFIISNSINTTSTSAQVLTYFTYDLRPDDSGGYSYKLGWDCKINLLLQNGSYYFNQSTNRFDNEVEARKFNDSLSLLYRSNVYSKKVGVFGLGGTKWFAEYTQIVKL